MRQRPTRRTAEPGQAADDASKADASTVERHRTSNEARAGRNRNGNDGMHAAALGSVLTQQARVAEPHRHLDRVGIQSHGRLVRRQLHRLAREACRCQRLDHGDAGYLRIGLGYGAQNLIEGRQVLLGCAAGNVCGRGGRTILGGGVGSDRCCRTGLGATAENSSECTSAECSEEPRPSVPCRHEAPFPGSGSPSGPPLKTAYPRTLSKSRDPLRPLRPPPPAGPRGLRPSPWGHRRRPTSGRSIPVRQPVPTEQPFG